MYLVLRGSELKKLAEEKHDRLKFNELYIFTKVILKFIQPVINRAG